MFSFASWSYWPISEGEKKSNRERERERKRPIGRGDTRVGDSEGVRREKVREFTVRGRGCQKNYVFHDYKWR